MYDDNVEVIYKNGEIKGYQMDIISAGLCPLFLPASFIMDDGLAGGVFGTRGFSDVEHAHVERTADAISVIASIIEEFNTCDRRYIFLGDYSLDPGLVYVSDDSPLARLVFKGGAELTKGEILGSFKTILERLSVKLKGERKSLKKAEEILSDGEPGFQVILAKLKKIAKEAYKCND